MARTTEAKVRAVIPTQATIDVAEFITNAGVLTDLVNTRASASGTTLTTAELTFIETYLAAHFYALYDPQYVSKKTGKAGGTFQRGKKGQGLECTDWGAQALLMDYSGSLAAITGSDAGTKQVGAEWLGS